MPLLSSSNPSFTASRKMATRVRSRLWRGCLSSMRIGSCVRTPIRTRTHRPLLQPPESPWRLRLWKPSADACPTPWRSGRLSYGCLSGTHVASLAVGGVALADDYSGIILAGQLAKTQQLRRKATWQGSRSLRHKNMEGHRVRGWALGVATDQVWYSCFFSGTLFSLRLFLFSVFIFYSPRRSGKHEVNKTGNLCGQRVYGPLPFPFLF